MTRESMLKFINSINRRGESALYLAISTSDCSVETLQCLLDNGADPWIGDDRGNTALAVALMYKRGLNFISPILTAARRQIMQNMGQNVMTDPSSCSSPNLVHDGRDRDMMSEFINLQNHRGITALLIAITKGCSVEIVELLLENGADPSIGDALLIAISKTCSVKIVELLLENGADPRSVDSNGNTALGLASMCKRGTNFDSPLITAARRQIINNLGQNVMTGPSVCSSSNLVQDGRDRDMIRESMLEFINNMNPRGHSALHIAIIFQSSVETLKILLENDADPRIPDNNGKTALDLAIQQKRHEAITEMGKAVMNMPKLHFLRNGMRRLLYSCCQFPNL